MKEALDDQLGMNGSLANRSFLCRPTTAGLSDHYSGAAGGSNAGD